MGCYSGKDVDEQMGELRWMIGYFWDVGFDNDVWINVRVVFVD